MLKFNYDRRRFLKIGTAGAAGAIVFKGSGSSFSFSQDKNIVTRVLGRTNIKIPVVSFGVMRADSPALCRAAWENGIILFDTANGYQNGNNESMLGNLFKDMPRNSFLIETKVKPAGVGQDGLPTSHTTADDFLSKFSTSLSRLKMDYVDFLLIHDVSTPELMNHKPLISAVTRLKKEKKTRFIGFSTHNNMAGVLNAAAESDIWDVVLTSYNFRLPDIEAMNQAIHKAAFRGIGIIAMKTLAGGGFLDKEKTKPVNTAAALKWVLSNPDVHTTIPGMTTFDHLTANLKVLADPEMNESEKRDLISMASEPGMYCIGCNKCLDTCKLKLPVPDLMRAYMYAYGYSNCQMAYELLGSLGTGTSPCINCNMCTVECTSNFNVREKIADISRLVNVPSGFIS